MKRIWAPFYQSLEAVGTFDLNKQPVQQPGSGIEEFDQLNETLSEMTRKMISDYRSLKQFSENASHEMQTPLAIIRAQTELLYQDIEDPAKLGQVKEISNAANRLASINQALLFLARIENRQFTEVEELDLAQLIRKKLEAFSSILEGNRIELNIDVEETVLYGNLFLTDSMISNLLINAIRHNLSPGEMKISLRDRLLRICNTGKPLLSPPETLFERFRKDDPTGPTSGLGLAIVKEICRQYGWPVLYRYDAGWHEVIVQFPGGVAK
jgi:signal transduction histidine kinase